MAASRRLPESPSCAGRVSKRSASASAAGQARSPTREALRPGTRARLLGYIAVAPAPALRRAASAASRARASGARAKSRANTARVPTGGSSGRSELRWLNCTAIWRARRAPIRGRVCLRQRARCERDRSRVDRAAPEAGLEARLADAERGNRCEQAKHQRLQREVVGRSAQQRAPARGQDAGLRLDPCGPVLQRQRAAAEARERLAAPEGEHTRVPARAGGAVRRGRAEGLRGVVDHERAVALREGAHRGHRLGDPEQVADDDRAGALERECGQRREIDLAARVDVHEAHVQPLCERRGGHREAGVRGDHDFAAPAVPRRRAEQARERIPPRRAQLHFARAQAFAQAAAQLARGIAFAEDAEQLLELDRDAGRGQPAERAAAHRRVGSQSTARSPRAWWIHARSTAAFTIRKKPSRRGSQRRSSAGSRSAAAPSP